MFILLASGFVNSRRASKQVDELQTIYEAIVGDPNGNRFGYLGDVGDYPETLSDLISPSPVPPGWNGPYVRTARGKYGVVYDQFSSEVEYFRTAPLSVPAAIRGCPSLYDIGISSVPRGTNEAYITYNPGTSVVDLLQGQYLVKVSGRLADACAGP